MGGACSTDEETRRHRENKKNRNNPTESYDTWQQKMLLDIGADPLAVVRDFPRMFVYVGTEMHHNYLPPGCENNNNNSNVNNDEAGKATSAEPSRRPSENPLAPSTRAAAPQHTEQKRSTAAAAEPHARGHHHTKQESEHGRPPLSGNTAARGSTNNNNTFLVSNANTPGPSPSQPQRLQLGGRTSQREPFRDDDAFATRIRRVREAVLLLSELCNERGTFGVAFEAAWDRLVAQGSHQNDGAAESEAASEYLAALQQQAEGRPASGTTAAGGKRHGRPSLPLDVHQLLLNACVDSGMIALTEEAGHVVSASATLRALVGGAALPQPSRTSPAGASRNSRPTSGNNSDPLLPETGPLLSNEAPADYGAGHAARKALKAESRRAPHEKDGAARSSSNSLVAPGTPGLAAGSASKYVVRSATFHLMEFATQGVMFFPVQRLKHVLWVPWSSHMQDVSWTIHFSLKDATTADLIALKQHTLNALYNNVSTVLSNDAAAVETVSLGGSAGQNQAPAAALAAARSSSTAVEQTADAFGAAATTSVPSDADAYAAPPPAGTAQAEQRGKRKIIVIQHVQTGRHYVSDEDRKTTPHYELDWACSIRVDQETLQEVFAPFQRFATPPSAKASALLGEATTTSAPPSLTPRAVKTDEDGAADGPPQREASEDNALETDSAIATAAAATTTTTPAAVAGGAEGIAVSQQPAVLQREVVAATVEVIAARVERPPHTMCMVSSTWKKRKEELNYVLEQQYNVHLEETDELHAKRLF